MYNAKLSQKIYSCTQMTLGTDLRRTPQCAAPCQVVVRDGDRVREWGEPVNTRVPPEWKYSMNGNSPETKTRNRTW